MEHRITSIETRLNAIEETGRGVLALLGAQLVVILFQNLRRRQESPSPPWHRR